MTEQEIQELARHRKVPSWVIKLVADAVAAEREACAKLCDEQKDRSLAARDKSKRVTDGRIYHAAAQTAAWNSAAIRARGNK